MNKSSIKNKSSRELRTILNVKYEYYDESTLNKVREELIKRGENVSGKESRLSNASKEKKTYIPVIFYILGALSMIGGIIIDQGLYFIVSGFIGGMGFIGFGKNIELLNKINNKL